MTRAPRSAGGVPYRGDARIKPKQDIRVPAKAVPCPVCGAEVDALCVTSAGTTNKKYHDARRRMAVRKSNQERGIA